MDEQTARDKDREALDNVKQKSYGFYERNITYIAAGTLVLSLTFIEKIVELNKSYVIWTLIVCWSILALTLLVNLLSHQISCLFHDKTINDFDNKDPEISRKIKSRNKIIGMMNWVATFGLIIGIIFLIIFCSINSIKMANDNRLLDKTDGSNYFEKGITITPPSTCANSSNSGSSSNSSSDNSGEKPNGGQTSNNSSGTSKKN